MEKIFETPHFSVTVKLDNDFIKFYKTEQIKRHKEWLFFASAEELENTDKDLLECQTFYDVPIDDFVSDMVNRQNDPSNWHYHLKEKNWFTNEIYDWLCYILIKIDDKIFNTDDISVLLYSFEQKCFHIYSLTEYIKDQLTYTLNNKFQRFQIIGVFKDDVLANEWTEKYFDWTNQKFKPFPFSSLTNK